MKKFFAILIFLASGGGKTNKSRIAGLIFYLYIALMVTIVIWMLISGLAMEFKITKMNVLATFGKLFLSIVTIFGAIRLFVWACDNK